MTESLYPFLCTGQSAVDLAEVAASTRAKIADAIALRQQVFDFDAELLEACAEAMASRFAAGGRLLAFGNGGSSTDAQDLASLFVSSSQLPAFGLTNDIAVITALSNDVGFDVVFSRQIATFGRAGDIAVGLSTSGSSTNLLPAFAQARRRGLLTVGLAGGDGGAMASSPDIDHLFVVPSSSVHRIQETQTTLYHVLWELTAAALESR
ncbi:D-sedoheptulose-7-phosphate isomerase [Lentzea flava]|uniref:Phosphoheptose isomerase n=1 Tax=Lentzea flava TaxID=103732 RepID=A0ABQ2URY7_9PSEU|nr:SIS domain-containing protein [Lentzea flava]MCP2197283.1 D-sedoheptulose 7-phosphate isomerase [Lentzea flava]GGU50217.1 phosphoheptose isomerase [Lentzea flava]